MCGIAGFYGKFNDPLLTKMIHAIRHRGPDGLGEKLFSGPGETRIGLAHARLAIIDLSMHGYQPMTISCPHCHSIKTMWLTYNGEIYNYPTLKKTLEKQGHAFHSNADSEILLHLYCQHGTDMLNYLNGIFSFALYDMKTENLFVARDQLGVKPFYYTQLQNGFLFSSEIKSILMHENISRELDADAIDHYLTYLWCPAPKTMLRAVKKLEPGHAMIVQCGKIIRHWQYYDIPFDQPNFNLSFDDLAIELADRVEHAVQKQLLSDVPVGAFLSGGLDSSAIVAMMRRLQPYKPIDCYTICVKDKKSDGFVDDLPYAKKVAEHLNVNLHIVDATSDMIQRLPEMLFYLDEPQADPAPINALLIAEQASKNGLKVLMSGAGGDDLFTGYRRHAALHYDRYWQWLPHPVKKSLSELSRNITLSSNQSIVRRFIKLFSYAHYKDDHYLESFFYWNTKTLRSNLYTNDFQKKISNQFFLRDSLQKISTQDRINRMLYLELKHFLADHNLNYTDKTAMLFGVEVRVPLIDRELVEFATKIPSKYKQRGKLSKAIFKKSMEPYLPKEIIYRPKTGFGAPLRQWFHGNLKLLVDEYLSEESITNRGLFNFSCVQKTMLLDRAGKIDATYTLFSLLCIEIWCRQFVDAATPSQLTI